MLAYSNNKKRGLLFIISLFAATSLFSASVLGCNETAQQSIPSTSLATPNIEVAFSPRQGASKLIIKNIQSAKNSIRVAAYSFTSKPIAQALLDAHHRGVEINVVLDKSQATDQHSVFRLLQRNGINTRINSRYAIMHNKFMIVDDETLQTGSFNYSRAAEEKNAENVLVIHNDVSVINQYTKQWQKLWDEAAERILH